MCSAEVPELRATEWSPSDERGELLLEGGDLGALGEHAGLHDAVDGRALVGADLGLCCGDHASLPSLRGCRAPTWR